MVRFVTQPAHSTRKSPPKQTRLGWGTLKMVGWATRPLRVQVRSAMPTLSPKAGEKNGAPKTES